MSKDKREDTPEEIFEEKSMELDKKDTNEQEIEVDKFTRLMFGGSPPTRRNQQNSPNKKTTPTNQEQKMDFNQYYTLMQQVDDIMGSYNRIKPMLKDLYPLLDFIKKWK